MKKVLLILACATIAGCGYQSEKVSSLIHVGSGVSLIVCEVKGHDYIVAIPSGHGVSVVHAASCPCMAPKMYSIEVLATTNRIPDIGDYLMEAK